MNDVQKTIAAKDIYETQCKRCKSKKHPCPLFISDEFASYKQKSFKQSEITTRKCFDFHDETKKEVFPC